MSVAQSNEISESIVSTAEVQNSFKEYLRLPKETMKISQKNHRFLPIFIFRLVSTLLHSINVLFPLSRAVMTAMCCRTLRVFSFRSLAHKEQHFLMTRTNLILARLLSFSYHFFITQAFLKRAKASDPLYQNQPGCQFLKLHSFRLSWINIPFWGYLFLNKILFANHHLQVLGLKLHEISEESKMQIYFTLIPFL